MKIEFVVTVGTIFDRKTILGIYIAIAKLKGGISVMCLLWSIGANTGQEIGSGMEKGEKMKPIRCLFGMHRYKPSEVEVYYMGDENGRAKYRAIHKCCYCGKEWTGIFTTTKPWERRADE